jgi:hypothetical protein
VQGALHRGFAHLEHARDLRRAEAEHVAQDEHRALSRRQVVQGGRERQADRLLELVARLGPGRRVGDRVEQRVRVRLQPQRFATAGGFRRRGDRLHRARPTALVAQRVQAAVRRDAVEPHAQRGSPVEEPEHAPRGQQRLLEKILGLVYRAEDAVAMELELSALRMDELAERLLVSRTGAGKRSVAHDRILARRFVPVRGGVSANMNTNTDRGGQG